MELKTEETDSKTETKLKKVKSDSQPGTGLEDRNVDGWWRAWGDNSETCCCFDYDDIELTGYCTM